MFNEIKISPHTWSRCPSYRAAAARVSPWQRGAAPCRASRLACAHTARRIPRRCCPKGARRGRWGWGPVGGGGKMKAWLKLDKEQVRIRGHSRVVYMLVILKTLPTAVIYKEVVQLVNWQKKSNKLQQLIIEQSPHLVRQLLHDVLHFLAATLVQLQLQEVLGKNCNNNKTNQTHLKKVESRYKTSFSQDITQGARVYFRIENHDFSWLKMMIFHDFMWVTLMSLAKQCYSQIFLSSDNGDQDWQF